MDTNLNVMTPQRESAISILPAPFYDEEDEEEATIKNCDCEHCKLEYAVPAGAD